MNTETNFIEVRQHLATDVSSDILKKDIEKLLAEIEKLQIWTLSYGNRVNDKLDVLEGQMRDLIEENTRLIQGRDSAFLERDLCVSLIAKLSSKLGFPVAMRDENIVIDLPSGRVFWRIAEAERYLFELFATTQTPISNHPPGVTESKLENISENIEDVYTRVMNPGLY